MEVIAWIGVSQALFSGFLTLTKGKKSKADRLLSAWLFLSALEFLTFGLESEIFTNFVFLSNSFLLFNPALFLYTRSLTDRRFKLRWIQLLHLVPYFFFKIAAWIIKEPQSLETYFQNDHTLWFRIVFGIIGILSWAVYLTFTTVILTKHRRRLKNEFSSIDLFKRLGWIHFVVITYLLYCFSVFLLAVLNVISWTTISITIYNYSGLLFFIYIFGFYGLKQSDIFKLAAAEEANSMKEIKTHGLLLSAEASEKIEKKLQQYFAVEKPYLNPDLNMSILAEQLKIPKHHLTEVLNKNIGKNFFQFVNEYRVEEVKKHLANPKNRYSIEAIGYECGFNSKSTFFSVFKNITTQTPKEFQTTKSKE